MEADLAMRGRSGAMVVGVIRCGGAPAFLVAFACRRFRGPFRHARRRSDAAEKRFDDANRC